MNIALAILSIALVSVPVFATATQASRDDAYPNRSIRIVVPVPPGPLLDTLPRMIGEKLSTLFGQPVIIENRPGASQNIGADAVFKAAPDGYTLLVSPPAPLVVSQHLSPKPSFDATAFVPVTRLIAFPHVIVANPKLPISSVAELIAYAKTNPNKLSYGSPGAGSTPQLAMEKLLQVAGIKLVHVPYQGMGPAQRDLIAGHIDVMFDAPGNVIQQIIQGSLKAIAVTGDQRIAELPKVPAISESLQGFVHTEWFAMVAPPRTPPQIAETLARAVVEILEEPDIRQRLRNFAVTPIGSSPAETAAFLELERARWREIVAGTALQAK